MNGTGAAAAVAAGGVIVAAHATARERVYGRSAVTEWLHTAAGAAILAGLIALAWLAFARWPGGGLPVQLPGRLAEVVQFPARWREAA